MLRGAVLPGPRGRPWRSRLGTPERLPPWSTGQQRVWKGRRLRKGPGASPHPGTSEPAAAWRPPEGPHPSGALSLPRAAGQLLWGGRWEVGGSKATAPAWPAWSVLRSQGIPSSASSLSLDPDPNSITRTQAGFRKGALRARSSLDSSSPNAVGRAARGRWQNPGAEAAPGGRAQLPAPNSRQLCASFSPPV